MRRAVAGFTLLEALMVMAIIGIMAAIALPGLGQLSASTKVKNASTELYLALIRARSEAVKRNRSVAVAAVDAGNWDAGWQIIADTDKDGAFEPDADRVVIEQGPLQRVAITMADDSVVFRPTGRISGDAPAFDLVSEDPDYADLKRCVSADLTGRPFIKTEACP